MSKLPAAMIEKDEKAPASGKRLRPRWASGQTMAAWTAVGLALAYWIWG
jgi:hypothetical protein